MDAKIKALAPWFGGKRTMADSIVAEFGPHQAYFEPFAGSMAVLLAKEPCPLETACDLHGDLTNLAMVLASDRWQELQDRASRTVMSDELHDSMVERVGTECFIYPESPSDVDDMHVRRAWLYLGTCWIGRNGTAGTGAYNQKVCVRYTKNGGSPSARWRGVLESMEPWHERLLNVLILRRDAFDVIPKIDDADGIVVYCDPPYLVKGAKYMHDFDAADHGRLAGMLRRFTRTRVVVSYYDDPRLADLYPGWTKRRIKATKAMVNQGMRDTTGATEAPEVLLINGPSLVETPRTSLFAEPSHA